MCSVGSCLGLHDEFTVPPESFVSREGRSLILSGVSLDRKFEPITDPKVVQNS